MPNSLREAKEEDITHSNYIPWIKRNGFSHGGMALLWIFTAFLAFQIFANVLGVVLIFVKTGGGLDATNAMQRVAENMDLIFLANTLGQILFLGGATWWFSRLHTLKQHRQDFFRFRFFENTSRMLGSAVLLIVTVQPALWFLGWINAFLPIPEGMEALQLQQMEIIETYLTGTGFVWVALFNIALIPAICEEILFRGYVLRSFQKSWGIVAALFISGIIFGIFHLQPGNFLPLSTIGIVLAVLTWVSRSIYPAMLAHFINNGASVLVAKFYPDTAFSEISPETMPPLWLAGLSMVVSGYLIYWLITDQKRAPQTRGDYAARTEAERN